MIRADYLMIGAIVLFLVAHCSTHFMISYYRDVAKQVGVAEDSVMLMETNPIARWILGIENFKRIFSFVIMPGMLSGMYWFLRNKYYNQKEALEGFAVAFLSIALIDALNDVSILLGVLI